MCAAYRTVSHDAVVLLAKLVPYVLAASERQRIYLCIREARDRGFEIDREVMTEEERLLILRK